jgi:2-polyprenyl-6-methoxyphenol hydroxylase-like FAD-dependent oxidoreductase
LRGDRTVFFFVIAANEFTSDHLHDVEAQKSVLREAFAHDGWECHEILEALDASNDLYFDVVSQIRMNAWSRERVALVGDACCCPSLLAGQGSALAMAGAYILAGELKKMQGNYQAAYQSYERLFRPFVTGKQRAAERLAGSFAPRTRAGLFIRNQVTRLMSLSPVANLMMGRMLTDSLALPAYEALLSGSGQPDT